MSTKKPAATAAIPAAANTNVDNVVNVVKLSASDLFAPVDLTRLEIPELSRNGQPGIIFLRTLTAGDVVPLITATTGDDGKPAVASDFQHSLVALAAVDENGNQLFANADEVRKVRLSIYNRISSALAGIELPDVLAGKAPKPNGEGSPTV